MLWERSEQERGRPKEAAQEGGLATLTSSREIGRRAVAVGAVQSHGAVCVEIGQASEGMFDGVGQMGQVM